MFVLSASRRKVSIVPCRLWRTGSHTSHQKLSSSAAGKVSTVSVHNARRLAARMLAIVSMSGWLSLACPLALRRSDR